MTNPYKGAKASGGAKTQKRGAGSSSRRGNASEFSSFDPEGGGGAGVPTEEELRTIWRFQGGVDADQIYKAQSTLQMTPDGRNKLTFSQYANFIYKLEGPELEQWQRRLYYAGMFDPDMYKANAQPKWGKNDAATRAAWLTMVRESLPSGKSVQEFLAEATDMFAADLAEYGKKQGRGAYAVTNPANVRPAAEKIGKALLGREPTEEEHRRIVAAMQASDRAGGAGHSEGEFMEGLNVEGATQQVLHQMNPLEYDGERYADTGREFLALLTGGGGDAD